MDDLVSSTYMSGTRISPVSTSVLTCLVISVLCELQLSFAYLNASYASRLNHSHSKDPGERKTVGLDVIANLFHVGAVELHNLCQLTWRRRGIHLDALSHRKALQ